MYTKLEHMKLWEELGIEYGLCLCGCGEHTNKCDEYNGNRGYIKGEPRKYISGHHAKWKVCPRCGGTEKYSRGRCKNCQRQWGLNNSDRRYINSKKSYERNREKVYVRSNARNRDKKGGICREVSTHIAWCKKQPCSYCSGQGGQHDHVVPLVKGGNNSISNIVPCCQRCNDSKGSRLLEEWLDRPY